jgi:hypothetical protein
LIAKKKCWKGGIAIKSKLFLILSLHRSGSSATAGVLHHLGVHMGERLLGENKGNPKGHFENLDFLKVNDRLLNSVGASWDSPPQPKKIANLHIPPKRIQEFLLNQIKPVWGIKDPRMLLTFSFWKPHLENVAEVTYVFVHRSFEDSVLSLAHRESISETRAIKILSPYLVNKMHFRRVLEKEGADIIDVHFHNLLGSPEQFVSEINLRLGKAPGNQLNSVRSFLDQSLKNF